MFKGSFTALITPFKGGKVDEDAFARFVEWQIAEGTHGLVPCGTTGESPTLSTEEHKRVIELCVNVAKKRVPIIAELATTAEQGLPGVEASVWNAFFFPKGTPDPIVRKLNRAMSEMLDNPAIRSKLEELGLEIVAPERRSPEYLARYLPEEIERWAKPIRQAGISVD